MQSFTKVIVSSLVICALLLGACAAPAPAPSEEVTAPSVVMIPSEGKAKAKITIAGAGFVPGETIEVTVVVGGVQHMLGLRGIEGFIKANESGAFSCGSRIYIKAEPGVYTLTAEGDKGSVATTPLIVVE